MHHARIKRDTDPGQRLEVCHDTLSAETESATKLHPAYVTSWRSRAYAAPRILAKTLTWGPAHAEETSAHEIHCGPLCPLQHALNATQLRRCQHEARCLPPPFAAMPGAQSTRVAVRLAIRRESEHARAKRAAPPAGKNAHAHVLSVLPESVTGRRLAPGASPALTPSAGLPRPGAGARRAAATRATAARARRARRLDSWLLPAAAAAAAAAAGPSLRWTPPAAPPAAPWPSARSAAAAQGSQRACIARFSCVSESQCACNACISCVPGQPRTANKAWVCLAGRAAAASVKPSSLVSTRHTK